MSSSGSHASHPDSEPPARLWIPLVAMTLLGLPVIIHRLMGVHPEPCLGVTVFGLAILSAAFLLR